MTFDDFLEGAIYFIGVIVLSVVLASSMSSLHTFANNGRHVFIGASPKGVVTFDTATGETAVRKPIFDSAPTTTIPEEQ